MTSGALVMVAVIMAAVAYGGWYYVYGTDAEPVANVIPDVPAAVDGTAAGATAEDRQTLEGLRARNQFRKLFAAGLTFIFGIQAIIIIGGVVRVLPLTGITLPFMSYGGSSLVANFLLVALLARISHEERS